jgi:SulP family sulfate permease
MIGYTTIIYNDPVYRPMIPVLAKLILFSAMVHQVCFSIMSVMPFAIGQVQDAGLVFLATIATSIAAHVQANYPDVHRETLHDLTPSTPITDIDPRLYDFVLSATSTTVVCIALCTALLGLALVAVGRARLAKLVSYLPISVIAGYLAFIGLFCLQAGFALATGLSISSPAEWGALLDPAPLLRLVPALLGGAVLAVVVRRFKNPAALPLAMAALPALFFLALFASGASLEDARQAGWVAEEAPAAGITAVFKVFDFGRVQWSAMPAQAFQWLAMVFVVAFSSCLDVAAIEIDQARAMDMDSEIEMIGWSNFFSGALGGYTGSYIFSQTIFTARTGSRSRVVGWVVAASELAVCLVPADVMAFVPRFFFAATLIFIGFDLLYEWLAEVVVLRKVTPHEHVVSVVTFVAMVATNIEAGLVIGLIGATLHFIYRYVLHGLRADPVVRAACSAHPLPLDAHRRLARRRGQRDVRVMELSGYVFFGSALGLLDRVKQTLCVASQDASGQKFLVSLAELEQLSRKHAHDSAAPRASRDEVVPLEEGMGAASTGAEHELHTLSHPLVLDVQRSERDRLGIRLLAAPRPVPAQELAAIAAASTAESRAGMELPASASVAAHTVYSVDLDSPDTPAHVLLQALPQPVEPSLRVPTQALVVDCTQVVAIDSTALRACFLMVSHLARSHNIDVIYVAVPNEAAVLMTANDIVPSIERSVAAHKAELSYTGPAACESAASSPNMSAEKLYGMFDLSDTMPAIDSPWGCVWMCKTRDLALRWSEARMLYKQ